MTKIRYEKEDDILSLFLNKNPVDFAEQSGDLIVHFSKKNIPVLIEVLNATKFLSNVSSALPLEVKAKVLA